MKKNLKEKNIKDTGGGCSICSDYPVVNISDTYWLCGPCVSRQMEDKNREIESLRMLRH